MLSAPGYALGKLTGVWVTELILMFISAVFAYKTSLYFGSRAFALIGVALGFIVFLPFFYEVAGTEEYSLPFVMISLYIFTRYYFNGKKASHLEITILGFCFASSVLIRTNLLSLWLGFCAVIFVEMIIKRDFAGLAKYILLFCLGIAIITMPIMLYLYANNAVTDYIQQNFITGSSRGISGVNLRDFILSFHAIINKWFCFTPLLAGLIWIAKGYADEKRGYYIGYSLSFILTVALHAVIRTNYNHYNMTLAPFLFPAFTFFAINIHKFMDSTTIKKYVLNCSFALFLCIFFSSPLLNGLIRVKTSLTDTSRRNEMMTGKTIDEETTEGDKIIVLGMRCFVYLFTQRDAASKYIYQTSGFNFEPNARNEFLSDMEKNKPAIIAIQNWQGRYNHLPEWYAPVYEMIENEYRVITDQNGYFLFKRK